MVCPAWDPGPRRAAPICAKFGIDTIAAFGGFDPGELQAGGRGAVPIHAPLEPRDICSVHRVAGGRLSGPIMRVGVTKSGGKARDRADNRRGARFGVTGGQEGDKSWESEEAGADGRDPIK